MMYMMHRDWDFLCSVYLSTSVRNSVHFVLYDFGFCINSQTITIPLSVSLISLTSVHNELEDQAAFHVLHSFEQKGQTGSCRNN